ncbi:GGDEF domain-containing protein [bacterium]|nr:MAG: GGDEF domain-containing protein [bacterium]
MKKKPGLPDKRKLFLYELTDALFTLEHPKTVGEKGLEALAEALCAKAGVCILKTSLTQSFELIAKIGPFPEEEDALLWQEFCERPELLKVDSPKFIGKDRFPAYFGEAIPPDFNTALIIPLQNGGELYGFYIVLDISSCAEGEDLLHHDANFMVARIFACYRAAIRFQEALGLAYVDSLTNLYNARYLPMIMERRLLEAKKSRKPMSFLFLDMDNFREVNTRFGHQAGGKALVEVGWILERFVRANDTVIRYGGDEFTVVLPTASHQSAREIAERIRCAIKEHVFLRRDGRRVNLTVSIGVATYPDDAKTAEELLHLADQAMYRGKETTKDAVYSAAGHMK